jgi:predicted HTH transcriptional regulator
MSLDNIQLPPLLVHDLYKNVMIDLKINQSTEVQSGTLNKSLAALGNNEKNIIVLVNQKNTIYLPEQALNFLMGILTACKLSMADIALINVFEKQINYKMLKEEYDAEKILLFDVAPSQIELPLQFPHYQVQNYNNQTYLCAPDLEILQADKNEKTQLWQCLKKIFLV